MKKLRWLFFALLPMIMMALFIKTGNEGFLNVARTWAMFGFIVSFYVLKPENVDEIAKKGFSVSKETDLVFDLLTYISYMICGAWVFGTLWLFHLLISFASRYEYETRMEKEKSKK